MPVRRRTAAFGAASLVLLVALTVILLALELRPAPPPPATGAWSPVVSTVAGAGVPGTRDGYGGTASFSDPSAVAVASDGTIFVADAGDGNAIRAIDPAGRVRTLAGNLEGFRDGRGTDARFHTPSGIAIGPDGFLYVADTGNHAIRRVGRDGTVTTLAGTGTPGHRDGRGADAQFDGPMGVAVNAIGHVFVADTWNDRIRRIDPAGHVATLAGTGAPGNLDGSAAAALFDTPTGLALAPDGALLVVDAGNDALRRISADGRVSTVPLPPLEDGTSWLSRPAGIAVSAGGETYVGDRRGRIVHLLAAGGARVLAGAAPGFSDGTADARFSHPTGLALDESGAVIVADAGNYLVRRIAPPGLRRPDAPRSPLLASPGLPPATFRQEPLPWPVDPQFGWQEVAGTLGEARGSASGGRERFHTGVDVRADEGALVRVVRSAKVDSPLAALGFGTLNESVAIGPFTYVHLRVGRDRRDRPLDPARFVLLAGPDGRPARVRIRRGTRFSLGDPIGSVNRFRHVHLNAGGPGREINVLTLEPVGFSDTVAPEIPARTVVFEHPSGERFTERRRGRTVLSGLVRIVADAWDRVDGNAPRRRLGLFEAGYQITHPDGTPAPGFAAPRTTIRFDQLPRAGGAPALAYAEGSGIAGQGARATRFRYTVTNVVRDGEAREEFWDTSGLPPGPYVVRVFGGDAAGNRTWIDVPVLVTPGEPGLAAQTPR